MATTTINSMLTQLSDTEREQVASFIRFLIYNRDNSQISSASTPIGVARGQTLYSSDFDLIEGGNDEVAALFGV